MSSWIMSWVAFSLSVFIAARILPFVHIRSLWTAVGVEEAENQHCDGTVAVVPVE